MATPTNFKETTRKQAEFRRQKAPFSKLKTEAEKIEFLANAEPFAREFWNLETGGKIAWWPTLASIPFMNTEYGEGFKTPEEAYAKAVELKAEFAAKLAALPTAG
ncbi:hypothetical protein Q5H92_22805 [Hymenobacter sp. M29]|uniref:Uncharacterized protein n=1 Tax=Hymenobacter mellowenesis TaxID=3063995 RepID=A0ABT9AIK4_9BACT|nr:hypothetical protein [Hymenobacter sp. M29]MDO7849212.1 hypothetical protein [Hymenobacter sp. M29]